MIMERRSTPINTLSLAFSKSIISTVFLSCRAARSAASLTRLARSAPEQRGVEDVGAVGGGDQDDALVRLEAIHLDQELVERLLPLVVAAPQPRAAVTAHR